MFLILNISQLIIHSNTTNELRYKIACRNLSKEMKPTGVL